jgi:hypothetical protein
MQYEPGNGWACSLLIVQRREFASSLRMTLRGSVSLHAPYSRVVTHGAPSRNCFSQVICGLTPPITLLALLACAGLVVSGAYPADHQEAAMLERIRLAPALWRTPPGTRNNNRMRVAGGVAGHMQ